MEESLENKDKEKSYEEYMEEGLKGLGLNRSIIKSGGTNPDYPATLAQGIINETAKEFWDVSYIMEKIERLNDFITWENNRFNSLIGKKK